jgi:hypothetical protein
MRRLCQAFCAFVIVSIAALPATAGADTYVACLDNSRFVYDVVNITGLGGYTTFVYVPPGHSAIAHSVRGEHNATVSPTNTYRSYWQFAGGGGFYVYVGVDLNGTNKELFDFQVEYCDV